MRLSLSASISTCSRNASRCSTLNISGRRVRCRSVARVLARRGDPSRGDRTAPEVPRRDGGPSRRRGRRRRTGGAPVATGRRARPLALAQGEQALRPRRLREAELPRARLGRNGRPLGESEASMNPNKALWEKGDFTRIAETMRESGDAFVESLGIAPGMRVLDLGSGDGTTALPAARRGADVLGVDVASNLVEAGNKRARREGLANCRFQEGDATNLSALADQGF